MRRLTLNMALTASMLFGLGSFSQSQASERLIKVPSPAEGQFVEVAREQAPLPVTLDFAKVMTFNEPARTIIIGNPAIVDGVLSDEYNIVLTGKSVGATNMIVLGEAGREIANLKVVVAANSSHVTTIYNGSAQQVYSCVDTCRPVGKADPAK